MKKNCERCRALIMQQGQFPKCELGHSIDPNKIIPAELCEKPITYSAYLEALRNKKQ